MSDIVQSGRKTQIREEFRPSEPLKESLYAFLEHPTDDDTRFLTQAERVLPTDAFRSAKYQEYLRTGEQRLRSLGSQTVALASNVKIRSGQSGITLLFDVADSDLPLFNEYTSALDEIEWEGASLSGVYVRIARSSLVHDVQRRREASQNLLRRLRDSSAKRQMRIGNPHMVFWDIILPDEVGSID